jgi:hypothetical protein
MRADSSERSARQEIPVALPRPEALSGSEIPYLRPGADVEWEKL